MKKIIIDKKDLIKLYIDQNLGINEIAKIYNVYNKVIKRNLEEYNIVKNKEQYKAYRKRIAKERAELCNQKYNGNGFASKELLQKAQDTMLKKYGNSNIGFKNDKIQQKAQDTIKLKYNVSAISKDPNVKIKINNSTMNHYGVKRAIMLSKYKNKAIETRKEKYDLKELHLKAINTYKNKTGYNYALQNPIIKDQVQNKLKAKRFLINKKIKDTIHKKYKRTSVSEIHYSEEVYNILKDKTKLQKYILNLPDNKRNIYLIAKDLNIYYGTLFKYFRDYNLINLVNNDGSNFEKEVRHFLDSLNIKYIIRTRKIISPYELDIYIPDKNIAIECNGTFWHSYYINKDKKYHYSKSKLCQEKGIRLIHIWEYEWNNNRQKPILQNIIKNALGLCENKIYARKCKIKVVNKTADLREFFDKNNIQGFRPGKFAICLQYNNEIVMSYIFGHCYFGKGKYECEVIRGATKLNYNVVGGASKIWKYFTTNYNYNNCVYYIDYNYFNGNSLSYLGLTYITTQFGFKNYFIKENKIKNRDPSNHSKIKELVKEGKVLEIYNAGTIVYVWKRYTIIK